MSDGARRLWNAPRSAGYRLGVCVLAKLEQSIELDQELRRRPRWSRACHRVDERLLTELGYRDTGGEGGQ